MTREYNNHLLIEVPEDAHSFIFDDELFYKASFKGLPNITRMIDLPPGDYTIVGLASDLTEEQWRGIVKQFKSSWGTLYYPEYPLEEKQGSRRTKPGFDTATESGLSLIQSLKMKNVLIVKKILCP